MSDIKLTDHVKVTVDPGTAGSVDRVVTLQELKDVLSGGQAPATNERNQVNTDE